MISICCVSPHEKAQAGWSQRVDDFPGTAVVSYPSERVGRQLMQNIPAWTYKAVGGSVLAGANAVPLNCCTAGD